MFDTGAEDAVTPEIAVAFGLKTEGTGTVRDSGGGSLSIAFARAAGVRVGDAEMTDQQFAVLPLPRHLTDRGNRPPVAGFIGYGDVVRGRWLPRRCEAGSPAEALARWSRS